jgi:hypothetical protein
MENNNIVIQIQRTHASYFAVTHIAEEPKILITKGGTWSCIENAMPLEKTITKEGAYTITELKKVRRVIQKKLSQSQMEKLHSLIHKINNVEAIIGLNDIYRTADSESYTSLSINYNDGRPIVAMNISNYIDFDNMSSVSYYSHMRSHEQEKVIKYEVVVINWKAYNELVKYIYSL